MSVAEAQGAFDSAKSAREAAEAAYDGTDWQFGKVQEALAIEKRAELDLRLAQRRQADEEAAREAARREDITSELDTLTSALSDDAAAGMLAPHVERARALASSARELLADVAGIVQAIASEHERAAIIATELGAMPPRLPLDMTEAVDVLRLALSDDVDTASDAWRDLFDFFFRPRWTDPEGLTRYNRLSAMLETRSEQ